MIRLLFPHPGLSFALVLVWIGLVNKVTPGNVLLGAILGLVVPLITAPYWPNRARIRRPMVAVRYVLVALWDIVVANVQVALLIVFKRNDDFRSQWIVVPLDLVSPEAITVLASTITMTPGTVSAMLSADARAILVHCLHTDDPDGQVATIKQRYERPLKEIFE